MAYDANPLKEENDISANVLTPQAEQTPLEQNTSPSGGQSASISQNQAPQTPSNQQKKKPKSGMGANLRQYVKANKPQTQRIAQAASKDVTKSAQNIGSEINQQQQQYQQQIQKNQQDRQQAQQFADQTLQAANTTADVSGGQMERFRNLVTGKEGFDVKNDLDVTRQDIDTNRLQQKAESASTARGQADILRDTFSRQGRQYNRGQSGLDNLLLAGDEGARQNVQQSAQQAAQSAKSNLQLAREKALQDRSALSTGNEEFRNQLAQRSQQAVGGIQQELANKVQAEKEQRAQLFSQLQGEGQKVKDYIQSKHMGADELNRVIADSYADVMGGATQQDVYDRIIGGEQIGENYAPASDISKRAMDRYLDPEFLETVGFGRDDWKGGTDNLHGGATREAVDRIQTQMMQIDNDRIMADAFAKAGLDQQDFRSGADINTSSVASDEQKRRYDALRGLAGITTNDAREYMNPNAGQSISNTNYNKILDVLRRRQG